MFFWDKSQARFSIADINRRLEALPVELFRTLVLLFPISVLFSPVINLGLGYRRLDELLVLLFLPLALFDLGQKGWLRRLVGGYWWALLALFGLYGFGVLHGGGWTSDNLRLILRPLLMAANIVVLQFWLGRAQLKINTVLWVLAGAIVVSGALGILAMFLPGLARQLIETYLPNLLSQDLKWRFNMSWRAMSVYNGYDAASMAYAMAIVITAFLVQAEGRRSIAGYISVALFVVALLSIISSARVGFMAAIAGLVILVAQSLWLGLRENLVRMGLSLAVTSVTTSLVAPRAFPHKVTMERFSDVLNVFKMAMFKLNSLVLALMQPKAKAPAPTASAPTAPAPTAPAPTAPAPTAPAPTAPAPTAPAPTAPAPTKPGPTAPAPAKPGPTTPPPPPKSEGISNMLESQVMKIKYPTGWDMILGYGDNGRFVSDVAYVVFFVKYGIVGLAILGATFLLLARTGYKLGRLVREAPTWRGVSANLLVPPMVAMFVLAATKGGLYFVSAKTGELFALILGLGIFEAETHLAPIGDNNREG